MRSFRFIIAVSLSVFLSNDLLAKFEVLEATGKIDVQSAEVDSYTANLKLTLAEDGRFIMRLDNHAYYRDYDVQFSYDGEDYFYLVEDKKEGFGSVTSSEIPIGFMQDYAREALWYVFGNRSYLSKYGSSGEMINLFQRPTATIYAYGYSYSAKMVNNEFSLPRSLSVFRDSSRDLSTRKAEERRTSITASEVEEWQWLIKESLDDGWIAIQTDWISETVLKDGLTLPNEVEVLVYQPDRPTVSANPVIRIYLDSWERKNVESFSFKPEVKGEVGVIDHRPVKRTMTHYVDPIWYSLGKGGEFSTWPSINDPDLWSRKIPNLRVSFIATVIFLLVLAVMFLFTIFDQLKKGRN